jgi:hypothetical protein
MRGGEAPAQAPGEPERGLNRHEERGERETNGRAV